MAAAGGGRGDLAGWAAALFAAALLGCGVDGVAGDSGTDTATGDAGAADSGDTADSSDTGWDPSPPTEVGTIVEFRTDCALNAGPRTLRWQLQDPSAHLWGKSPEGNDPAELPDWLPVECVYGESSMQWLTWADNGDIVYAEIHSASPVAMPEEWLGVVAMDKPELSPECRAVLEEHDALTATLHLTRLSTTAP